MRQDLAGPNPSPLEKLGAERVASCWLQLHYAELIYDQELPKLSLDQDDHYQKRLDRLHKRYLSATHALVSPGPQAPKAEGGANQHRRETANQHRSAPISGRGKYPYLAARGLVSPPRTPRLVRRIAPIPNDAPLFLPICVRACRQR